MCYSPADSADHAEEYSKLYYLAEKDRLFEVKDVLLFVVCCLLFVVCCLLFVRVICEICGRLWGFVCADCLSTLA